MLFRILVAVAFGLLVVAPVSKLITNDVLQWLSIAVGMGLITGLLEFLEKARNRKRSRAKPE